MKKIDEWHKIKRESREGDPLPEVQKKADLRYETGGKPPKFGVVRAMQYDLLQPSCGWRLIYFSPVACSWLWEWMMAELPDARISESPADAPEGVEAFGFVSGDREFVADLLKDLLK
jgi:hypothetical protein